MRSAPQSPWRFASATWWIPTDIAIYRQLAGGVTAANLLHGSANPIGGQNQVIKMRWGGDADSLKLAGAKPGVKFALGENPKQSNFGDAFTSRYPQSRMGVREIIEATFEQARTYERDLAETRMPRHCRRAAICAWTAFWRFSTPSALCISIPIVKTRSSCSPAWPPTGALPWARFSTCLEGYKVADAIAEIGAGGSTFSDWWGYKMEVYDAIPSQHGADASGRRGHQRELRQQRTGPASEFGSRESGEVWRS